MHTSRPWSRSLVPAHRVEMSRCGAGHEKVEGHCPALVDYSATSSISGGACLRARISAGEYFCASIFACSFLWALLD